MTTEMVPCPAPACGGTVTIVADDHGTTMRCDTCTLQTVSLNEGQLDIGIVPEPTPINARNDVRTLEEWVCAASMTAMRRIAILQEIYAIEQWAAAWGVPVQAIHVIATHELNGYGLASIPRRTFA